MHAGSMLSWWGGGRGTYVKLYTKIWVLQHISKSLGVYPFAYPKCDIFFERPINFDSAQCFELGVGTGSIGCGLPK